VLKSYFLEQRGRQQFLGRMVQGNSQIFSALN